MLQVLYILVALFGRKILNGVMSLVYQGILAYLVLGKLNIFYDKLFFVLYDAINITYDQIQIHVVVRAGRNQKFRSVAMVFLLILDKSCSILARYGKLYLI